MFDEELKNIWNTSSQQERVKLNKALLLQDVKNQLQSFERGIKIRNGIEIGIAVVLLPALLFMAVFIPFTFSKVGAVILMVFCALVIYKLKKVRSYKPKNIALPIQEYLQEQRLYLLKEMELLASVSYWYIAPFFVGVVFFFLGFAEMGILALAIRIAGCLVLCGIIYFINKREVDKTFKPLIKEIDKTIAGLQL